MGVVSNFLTAATLLSLGFVWMAQGSKPGVGAPPLVEATGLAEKTRAQSGPVAQLLRLPAAAISGPQKRFAGACLDSLDSTIAFAMVGLDKGQACVCMAQRLKSYGVGSQETRVYNLAGEMMEMTISRTLARENHSSAAIRDSLISRHPDMKRKIIWMEGALFSAFAHCVEEDETAGPRIDSIRKLMSR